MQQLPAYLNQTLALWTCMSKEKKDEKEEDGSVKDEKEEDGSVWELKEEEREQWWCQWMLGTVE